MWLSVGDSFASELNDRAEIPKIPKMSCVMWEGFSCFLGEGLKKSTAKCSTFVLKFACFDILTHSVT